MKISIIIPVLNEEEAIAVLLPYLKQNSNSENISEIIVVDGGSDDTTVAIAKAENVLLISSEKGRAKQMNASAKQATGDILYFLHADSFPPKGFDQFILDEVTKGNPAGCFQMRFDHNHWWLRLASWLTKFSWRACRGGDQSQFITRSLFDEIGGYDESYIIYEDNILINELYKRKQFVVIPQWLTTSARRYEDKGIWRLQYHFWTIYVKKWFGASADDIYRYYLRNIKT
ncbi:MAG: TIGR04283 family arsenosugar biosynthesis glycosyltransferase [Flavobacteriaceae bacterium]|nr:TIGR04283 family arsenosugar biosynthesis glycosyltransferase [Flavobacteriaceae bacterium]